MEKNKARSLIVYFLPLLFFVGCSLDYSQAALPEDLSEKVPETVLIKLKQTSVDNGRIKRMIEADKAENFTKAKQTVFENLHYIEYDVDGSRIVEGKANHAVYETESENAELSGSIWFHSYTEKTSIYAESLSWKNKEKLLTSKPEFLVRLVKEDGSQIQGRGFETDLRLKQIVFSQGVSGVYKEKEKMKDSGDSAHQIESGGTSE
jgi:LPS export ABC transporter protein LptC